MANKKKVKDFKDCFKGLEGKPAAMFKLELYPSNKAVDYRSQSLFVNN